VNITTTILTNIRLARISKAYSQEYLAAKLHISQNAYSKTELGYSNLSLSRFIDIASILEVDIVALLVTEDVVIEKKLFET